MKRLGSICLLLWFAAAALSSAESMRRTPTVRVVEHVSPAVVNIAAEAVVRERDPFFGSFFSRRRRVESLGSGLIVAANGIVVTNAHVIEGASRIVVTTADGKELEARRGEVISSARYSSMSDSVYCITLVLPPRSWTK